MYYSTLASAALHHVLLRSLGDDKVVARNATSALFCTMFVALGVANRPALLARSMLGYLVGDSASMVSGRAAFSWEYAAHHAITGLLLLTSIRGDGAYDDMTLALGGYGEASTVLLCIADTFKQRPSLRRAYPRLNQLARYSFAFLFLALRVGYWSFRILPWDGPPGPRCGLYALLGLQYVWGVQIGKKVLRLFWRGGDAKNIAAK